MEIHFKRDNGPVDEAIHDLIEVVGGVLKEECLELYKRAR